MLLPLREKVSLEATDEGSRRPFPSAPSPDPLRGPPSPAWGEGNTHQP
ncbi:hypothetical protein [Caulobacter segnis]|nr:hypothetical protein [Caulobacter segnis]